VVVERGEGRGYGRICCGQLGWFVGLCSRYGLWVMLGLYGFAGSYMC